MSCFSVQSRAPCFSNEKACTFASSLHGNGVRASTKINADEVILSESPLVHLQTLTNKQDILVCSSCLRFLGSPLLLIKFLSKKITRQDKLNECYQCVSDDSSINCHLGDIIPCNELCGEYYCSEECKVQHWQKSHKLLCTGKISDEEAEDHSLVKFKIHALSTNEIFIMCSEVFASIVLKVQDLTENMGVSHDDSIDMALAPFNGYVKELWWDAAIAPKKTNPKKLRKTLQQLVTASYNLLSDALDLEGRNLDKVLSKEYLSRTIGMFEQNNVGIRLESPINHFIYNLLHEEDPILQQLCIDTISIIDELPDEEEEFSDIDDDSDEENSENVHEEGENQNSSDCESCTSDRPETIDTSSGTNVMTEFTVDALKDAIENAGGPDRIFPPLDGTAFYSTICQINHSCDPNVIVRYDSSPEFGLQARLYALRDIEDGEELLQSYIDNTLGYDQRQDALKDYGFICACSKCEDRI